MTLVLPRRTVGRINGFLPVVLLACAVATSSCGRSRPVPPTLATTPVKSESEIRDLDIAFYGERADRDPTGAADLARQAGLYLQRSRETGDPRDAIRAEEAARKSIRNRTARNDAASQILSSALLSQHRFAEALDVARQVRDRNPDVPALRASVAEIEMELGQYDSAKVTFAALGNAKNDLSVAPRLSRWAEVRGHPDEARMFIHNALTIAKGEPSLPREQLAWFWLRSGDIELRTGHLSAADSMYKAGLAAHPNDYRVLAAMCHLAAVRGRWNDAIAYGQLAIAQNLDPATLGILSDAAAAVGDTAQAKEFARVLDVAVLTQPGAYHRAWSLFLLDHDRHVDKVYEKIRTELKTRKDIYAYDLLAWALHKQGKDAAARDAIQIALSQGTQDAQLFYHAAEIESALGHATVASAFAAKGAAANPSFHLPELQQKQAANAQRLAQ
ncbi:MAG: tetratricopeptide repeat protein [Gemmatimonadaceae bacterium]